MNSPIQAALTLHRSGNLAAAHDAYRKILAANASDVDALYLLGVLLSDQGNAEGVGLLERAVALWGQALSPR